jgi:hypothetical protein
MEVEYDVPGNAFWDIGGQFQLTPKPEQMAVLYVQIDKF